MMKPVLISLAIAYCIATVQSQQQTSRALRDVQAVTPAPTTPATLAARDGLLKRSWTSICGYVITDPTASYYCDEGYVCAWNTNFNVFGCCGSTSGTDAYDCYMPTTCYNYGKLSTLPPSSNRPYTVSCTDPAYPYCEVLYESGMTNFDCNKFSSQTVYFQYALVVDGSVATTTSKSSIKTSSTAFSNIASAAQTTIPAVVGPATTATSFSRTQATGTSQPSSSTLNVGSVNSAISWQLMVVGMAELIWNYLPV